MTTSTPPTPPDISIEELAASLPKRAALMGLDLGTVTIGLALSDLGRSIASPLLTIARKKFSTDAKTLLAEAEKHQVAAFVLGLPLNMDGSEGRRVQSTRTFARNLAAKVALPIAFWDERLSTAAVDRMLIAADTRRDRRAEVVDKLAAAYILQGFLDRLRINR